MAEIDRTDEPDRREGDGSERSEDETGEADEMTETDETSETDSEWAYFINEIEGETSAYCEARAKRMVSFLAGHHPRCGERSPLINLPADVLRWIAEILSGEEIWCDGQIDYPYANVRCLRTRSKVTSIIILYSTYSAGIDFVYYHPSDLFLADIRLYEPDRREGDCRRCNSPDLDLQIRIWWSDPNGERYVFLSTAGRPNQHFARLYRLYRGAPLPEPETLETDPDREIGCDHNHYWTYPLPKSPLTLETILYRISDWSRRVQHIHSAWSPMVTHDFPSTSLQSLFDRAFSAYLAS